MKNLKIAETFTSIQGEGHLTGKVMHFIRLAGCSVKQCALHPANKGWCDTDWSMSASWDRSLIDDYVATHIRPGAWFCITGGEPMDQPDAMQYLVGAIREAGGLVMIQTSGTKRVNTQWDWLTVGPKVPARDLTQKYGQELKVVYCGQGIDELRAYFTLTKFWNYYIQPLWADGKECNLQICKDMVMRLNQEGQPWEFSLQVHKHIGMR